jgi:hypothetical protein
MVILSFRYSVQLVFVMKFGCVPVVLSDELAWAFEEGSLGGSIKTSQFALQFPQKVITISNLSMMVALTALLMNSLFSFRLFGLLLNILN